VQIECDCCAPPDRCSPFISKRAEAESARKGVLLLILDVKPSALMQLFSFAPSRCTLVHTNVAILVSLYLVCPYRASASGHHIRRFVPSVWKPFGLHAGSKRRMGNPPHHDGYISRPLVLLCTTWSILHSSVSPRPSLTSMHF